MAEQIFELVLGPFLQAQLEAALAPLGDARRWATALAGLHDLGKCSPTFQGLRADIAERDLDEREFRDVAFLLGGNRVRGDRGKGVQTDMPHGKLTAVQMRRLLKSWGASRKTTQVVADVLGGHHGYVPLSSDVQNASRSEGFNGGESWRERCDEFAEVFLQLYGLPRPEALAWADVEFGLHAQLALAALTSTSDWLASSRPQHEYAGKDVDLAEYLRQAPAAEAARVAPLRWEAWRPPEDTSFSGLFPNDRPRPIQTAVEDAVRRCDGAGIFVISAPTGEGKTKAALQGAAALVQKLSLRGFYLAMPTRASGNQAFEVVDQLLARQGQSHLLHLFHSSAAEYLKGRRSAPVEPVEVRTWGIAEDGEAEDGDANAPAGAGKQEGRGSWFSASKRVQLASLGVGTIDQALMAAIRSGHVYVRLAGLSGKVIVFDEVHGYDVHMSVLLQRLLGWLGSMRVPVVLLSATLSTLQRQSLVHSWRAGALGQRPEELEQLPSCEAGTQSGTEPAEGVYPSLMWVDGSASPPQPLPQHVSASVLNTDRTVRLEWVDTDERMDKALYEAAQGQCVALVQNVVAHAQQAFERIKAAVQQLPEEERPLVALLHAQLSAKGRAEAEKLILRCFGPDTSNRPKRAIVVGTQLLEESLDLDFDVMISAVAPIDSLIQRMGRIHRHRAADEGPPLRMVLTGVEPPYRGKAVPFPPHTTRVYDESVLLRTWALLRKREFVRCPDEVQELIDRIYDAEGAGAELACPPEWTRQWEEAEEKRQARVGASEGGGSDTYKAEVIVLQPPCPGLPLWRLTTQAESPRQTRRESGSRETGSKAGGGKDRKR